MLNDTFSRRFDELEKSYGSIPWASVSYEPGRYVPNGQWHKWATSAQSLILAVFGESSPHYKNFLNIYEKCTGSDYEVEALKAVFLSAKEDFDGGYVFDVELRVSGEVFGDFVALARQALSEGHKDVAAVLACAALEDALKRYSLVEGLDVAGRSMQDVVNSLKSKGLVAGAQRSLLDTMPRIRNFALHADWGKLSEPDVSSVIGFVEQFLLSKFSRG